MNLQYLPSEAEIRLIVENCPVCIDGEATEKEEVSGHRNLARVETNAVRGGMALVLAEGIAGKARKLKSKVEKMKMEGWDWLDKLIAGAAKTGAESESMPRVSSRWTNTSAILSVAGRSLPTRCEKGDSGSGMAVHAIPGLPQPGLTRQRCTSLGDFLAVGTQMKTERPGKACGVVPVDSIEGPTVRLTNGEVLRVDDEETAQSLTTGVEKILDVGEILISYGEFLENNHPLVPCGYCEEWWLLERSRAQNPAG